MKEKPPLLLNSPVEACPGVGEKRALGLHAAGFHSVFDLLRWRPKRYEDRTRVKPLAEIVSNAGPQGVFRANLTSLKLARVSAKISIVWATFSDAGGTCRARWFNQPFMAKNLVENHPYFLYGPVTEFKTQIILDNPEIEPVEKGLDTPRPAALTPVYPSNKALQKAKVSPRIMRTMIAKVLGTLAWEKSFPTLDPGQPFAKLKTALWDLHWPHSLADSTRAIETMAFFDQVLFQMGVLKRREKFSGDFREIPEKVPGPMPAVPVPFELTQDQHKAILEITADLGLAKPMNRMLQGDVGSGKTIIAFLTMRHMAEHLHIGVQCAFMAPTEILAQQQKTNFLRYFPELSGQTGYLTGDVKSRERAVVLQELASGKIRFLFGTHALFQDQVQFRELRFCIIDEQHKFGVEHRRALTRKGTDHPPHLLLISATPIPRSLSLTIFGDMDISVLRSLPPGRKPIQTKVFQQWEDAVPAMKIHLVQNFQIYYICPLIFRSEKIEWASIEEVREKVVNAFPEYRVVTLSGRDSSETLFATMRDFNAGHIHILIATTIVEVGIDNPRATCMVIENAERFGLSQLHQLRGRIGRGSKESECLLISPTTLETERLQIMARTNDGFSISQEDLRLRGPGDLVGTRQSGLCHPAFSSLARVDLIEKARHRAMALLSGDPPETRNWFLTKMHESFGTMFETFMDGG